MYDWANSAYSTLIQTFVFAAYFTRQVAENETVGSAQWGSTIGMAGAAVAIGGPILGAVADQTGRRKPWIGAFTLLCTIATAFLWWIRPSSSDAALALMLVGLGTVAIEYAVIFYNAMLPSLASEEQLGRWSGWGWALGYAGGLVCLVVALLAFVMDDPWIALDRETAQHVRITFPLVAAWYLIFALPLFLFTPDQPPTGKRFRAATQDGLRQLWHSLRNVRRYGHILRFLIAHMVYADGLATLFAFGGVYAAGTFNMTEQQILLFGIALNLTAGLGAAGFAWVDDWIGSKPTILISLAGLILPISVMLMARSTTMFWVFGLILGIFVGPAQAASRSYLARVAPEPLRNEMFGLFALSGKATSFLGPLMVGWLTYWSGSQRIGMTAIVALFAVGFLLMLTVPPARASA